MTQDIYQKNGYVNREDYLTSIAEDFGVPDFVVFSMAEMLGENEDFDALITELEDAEGMDW